MTDETVRDGPLVSVILAALNAESTLAAQLEALSRQEVSFAWEVLVCDNGSTDGTARIVEQWRARLPQLSLVDASARRGAGAARNIGASVARAPQLLFCDADDVVADDWVAQLTAALGSSSLVLGDGDEQLLNSGNGSYVSWEVNLVIAKPYWPQFLAGGGGNMGISATVFAALGGFDESLGTGEDIDLCWRVQLAGEDLGRCKAAVVHIRKHTGVRAIYLQAYSYALGDRQLKHKFSAYIDAYWRSQPEQHGPEAEHTSLVSGPRSVRGIARQALRLLRRQGRANAAWRLGLLAGSRTNSVDFSASPVFELAP